MKVQNPFEFGRELAADELVDREAEVEQLVRTAENRGKLFLIGPRRYGKTSIMAAAEDRLEQSGTTVLRYDAEAYETLELLARALLTGATRELTSGFDKAASAAKRFFGALRPEVTLDPESQALSVTLGVSRTGPRAELPLLTEVLDGIEQFAADAGRSAAIMIDEFQHVARERGEEAERQIRASVQRHRHVAYVFAGSKTGMLADMTGDPSRPFYKLGSRLFVADIPQNDFLAFLRDGFTRSGFDVDEHALTEILARAEEVPFNVQQLAHYCWELLRISGDAGRLTIQVVARALEQIIRNDDPFYTKLWNDLTVMQKKALKAVIREDGTNLYSAEVGRRHGVAASSMQNAVAVLEDKEIIRTEESRAAVRMRLVDPFFAAWLDFVQKH